MMFLCAFVGYCGVVFCLYVFLGQFLVFLFWVFFEDSDRMGQSETLLALCSQWLGI